MSHVVAPGRDRDSANSSKERIHVGLLAQENLPVPPPVPGGSIARIVYHLAHELVSEREGRFDAAVCSLRHPDLPERAREAVRYLFAGSGQDPRRHAAYDRFTWPAPAERLAGVYDEPGGIRPCRS
jgi:hypothetical protein